MSIIDRFKKTKVSKKEQDAQSNDLLNEEMSENDLEGIAAAGAWIKGTNDDDFMIGGDGDDKMVGKGGEDILIGGDGDDTLDGGYKDGADDIAYGGDGNDVFFWGPTKDGSDTFIGGEGNDTLKLDLKFQSENNIQDAFNNGTLDITLFDSSGNPVEITDDMWVNGSLQLPEGSSGTITGPEGDTLTFADVEVIKTL